MVAARTNWMVITVVALWLASTASLISGWDFYTKAFENRTWTAWPGSEQLVANPRKYTKQVGDYAADHFGLRSSFIRLHNRLKYSVFHTSPNELVVLGKNGWLFWAGEGALNFARNVTPFTTEEFVRLSRILQKTQAWLSKRHIDFLVVVPPDSVTVNTENLPNWMKPYPGLGRRDAIIQEANRFMKYPLLELTTLLQEGKKHYPTYHPTDSHWTNWGGFLAVDQLMQQLQRYHPSLQWQPQKFVFEPEPVTHRGRDLARSIGLPDIFDDYEFAAPKDSYVRIDVRDVHNYTTYCARCQDVTVLMVWDSFGEAMQPYLSTTFRKVVYVWDNTIPFARIREEKPDIVIFQFVERKLAGLPPYEIPND